MYKGALIVGNPFFDIDNPHWKRQARHELYKIWERQKEITSTGHISRYINISSKNKNKTRRLSNQRKLLKKLYMEYLHAQQRVNFNEMINC